MADDIPESNSLLEAALAYAARGWPVLTITPQGKAPTLAKWPTAATTEPSVIRPWWAKTPTANVGIVTGERSGFWVLDIDGAQGLADLDRLEAVHGKLPVTRVVCTPSGGGHYYWRMPAGVAIVNRTKIDGTQIDIRGTGGCVVAPPSRTADGEYSVAADVPIVDAPAWLVDWVTRRPAPPPPPDDLLPYRPTAGTTAFDRAVNYVAAMPPAVAYQGGHPVTFRVARACYTGFGLSVEDTFRLLRDHYNPRCEPPWDEKDLRHKAQSAADTPSKYERGYLLHAPRAANGHTSPASNANPSERTSAATGGPPTPEFEFVDLSTIKARPVKWAVPGRIPRGTLCLIAGYGGSGKSTLTRHLAARITTGRPAFGLTYDPDPPGDVLLIAAEDDYETSVVPHLIAEGADLTRIRQVFKLQVDKSNRKTRVHLRPDHLIELREHLATLSTPPRLLVVDPVASFASKGNVNEARAAEVRAILDPLSELAQETGMAVLVVAHLNKSANHGPASNRVAGSRAYIDAARLAYCVDANPDDPDQRLLMPVKANIFGVNKQTAPYALQRIDEDAATALRSHPSVSDLDDADFAKLVEHLGTVRFGSDVAVSADDVFGGKSAASATKAESCAVWLREFVREFAYPSVEVEKAAADASFGLDCLKRAKAKLKADGLRHKKDEGTGGVWWCGWGPPEAWVRRPDPRATDADGAEGSKPTTPSTPCTSSTCSTSSSPSTSSLFSLSKEVEEEEEVEQEQEVEQVQGCDRRVAEHLEAEKTGRQRKAARKPAKRKATITTIASDRDVNSDHGS